jgi:hypothetical protein
MVIVCVGGELGLSLVVMVSLVVGFFVSPFSLTTWWRIAELNEVWMDEVPSSKYKSRSMAIDCGTVK